MTSTAPGGNIAKTEVFSGLPDVEFTQIQKVNKDARGDAQFVRTKPEMNATHQESRTHEEKLNNNDCNHDRTLWANGQ